MGRLMAVLAAAAATTLAAPADASTLVYTPTNPNFGGSPLNGGTLLAQANAISSYQAPKTAAIDPNSSEALAAQFVRQLQSRLMSSLAAKVSDSIFGENATDHGEVVFGDQTVTFDRGLDAIEISILNTVTGEITRITVPVVGS